MIRCRVAGCSFETPAKFRSSKTGKMRDGWALLDRHYEDTHKININVTALHGIGACDDRVNDPDPKWDRYTPEPGAPLDDPRRTGVPSATHEDPTASVDGREVTE